jgi:hypothetical protein
MGKGTYGSQVGRPPKRKNSTDNYAQTQRGKGQNSTDNMNDGPIDRQVVQKVGTYRKPSNYSKSQMAVEMQRTKLEERKRDFQLEMQSRKRKATLKKLKQEGRLPKKVRRTKRDG